MMVTCTKPQAAIRQLDEAIVLLLADHDPLAIHTLAAASFGVFADLAEHARPGASWRAQVIKDSGMSEKEAVRLLHEAPNFLKHANRDPDGELSFPEEENDHLIFVATLECMTLGHPASYRMQLFQVWYLALYPEKIGEITELVQTAREALPGLDKLTRNEQLARGAEFAEIMLPKDDGKREPRPSTAAASGRAWLIDPLRGSSSPDSMGKG